MDDSPCEKDERDAKYSDEEAQRRFEAALRGAGKISFGNEGR
jgi:hypothetical protein